MKPIKYDIKTPCQQCPFRKLSLPGYLGSYTPETVIQHLNFEIPFLCHTHVEKTVGYEDPKWDEKVEPQHCAGALIFTRNMCKLPRDAKHAAAVRDVKDCPEVFENIPDFMKHHSSKG